MYPRAFQIVAGDGLYVNPDFFKLALEANKHVIAVLKNENRDLIKDARQLFEHVKPIQFSDRGADYTCWDIEGFKTWPQLGLPVRVIRSLETKRVRRQNTGEIEEATSEWLWVTTMPVSEVPTQDAVRIGHARWSIENEGGFNEMVTFWNADHLYRHQVNAITASWLLAFWAYNLFHSFVDCNLKPIAWAAYTALHIAQLITADFYGCPATVRGHPP